MSVSKKEIISELNVIIDRIEGKAFRKDEMPIQVVVGNGQRTHPLEFLVLNHLRGGSSNVIDAAMLSCMMGRPSHPLAAKAYELVACDVLSVMEKQGKLILNDDGWHCLP